MNAVFVGRDGTAWNLSHARRLSIYQPAADSPYQIIAQWVNSSGSDILAKFETLEAAKAAVVQIASEWYLTHDDLKGTV